MDALILEKEPLALGAYSTRILRRDYQRALMRVRRSADSAQADVRADSNGVISLASRIKVASGTSAATTLGEFVANSSYTDVDSLSGATSALVTVWYDQSGSNNHMTQTVTNYQPRIVSPSGTVYQSEDGPNVLFFPTTPDSKYMDVRELNGDFTVHLGFRLLSATSTIKMYDGTADILEISRSSSSISLTNVTSSVTTLNGYNKGESSSIDFSGSGDSFVTVSGTFSSTGTARVGGLSGGLTDLYIYNKAKNGKRTKKVEAIQSRERSTPLAFSNRQDLEETSFLNQFQGAGAAFSLRDLNGSSGTKLISVRRDADNKEVVVQPDESGYVSLESPVTWSDTKTTGVTAPTSTVSYATSLGQFLGDAGYSDPDSLGSPSNGYVVQMFDQVPQNAASGRRLLDYHTGSEAAYSFKRLSTAYTGAAFEVKAFVSGSVVDTSDIEFDSTGNSYANLASYISQKNLQHGTAVGIRCSKWYDQSGNGRDLVQATESTMPLFSLSEKNGEVALTALNGVPNMSVTGLNIPAPYSYAFSFDRSLAFDGDIISFDTDVSIGIDSGSYRITSESNVISGGSATAQTMKTLYGVHDGASSEIGVDGTYTSGTGASKAVSFIKLFPTTGFNGRVYEFILWGENKSSDTNQREDIELYSKELYRTEDPNAKALAATAQPKLYDATNGLITDGGRTALQVSAGNHFLFDRANIAGKPTVSSFACFSTSDTRGGLYGIDGLYHGPYINSANSTPGTFLTNFGTPESFLDGDSESISSAAEAHSSIADGTKQLHSLINADASSWTSGSADDITIFNFNSTASSSDTLLGKYHEFVFFTADVSDQRESIEANINNAFSSFSNAKSQARPKLLNNFPSAAAAYSVRQLNANYTGPLMRIDNGYTELDIYPLPNGDLDVSSILEHASVSPSGDAGVAVWYDQSGNGNDAVQATNANQPLIASSNAVVYENGKPAVEFDGVGDGFSLSSAVGSSVVKYAFTTHSVNSSDTSWSLFTDNNNSAVVPIGQSGSSSAAAFGFTITNFYKDGVSLSISSRDDVYQSYKLGEQSLTTLHLGTDGFIQSLFNRIAFLIEGKVQETIIYESDQSSNRKEIESNINKYFDITPESPKPLLLDKVKEEAAAAYSLRKLRSTYNGPAARVRRESDNVEVDVYFDGNGEVSLKSRVANATETTSGSSQSDATFTLNTQTFGEFVGDAAYVSGGARSAFVVCWYDQSRNENDAIQNAAANQPKLYDSVDGLVVENGKPAMVKNSGGSGLFDSTATFSPAVSDRTVFSVTKTTGGRQEIIYGGSLWILNVNSSGSGTFVYNGTTYIGGSGGTITTQALRTGYFNAGGNSSVWTNGGDEVSGAAGTNTMASISKIGGQGSAFRVLSVMQEIVLYDSNQSANRTKIEDNINNHYSIYQGSPEPKLLNSYSGAAAAYSLRVLDGTYTGPLVRVRRDSDNIEMDVYPDANGVFSERSVVKNKVETSTGVTVGTPNDSRAFTFGEFAYGANCYVVEWKDQSGSGNHASQNTAANQPKIYDSSTGVVTENGKPAVQFIYNDSKMFAGSVITDENVTIIGVATKTANGVFGLISTQSNYNAGYELTEVSGFMSWRIFNSDLDVAVSATTPFVTFAYYDGSTQGLSINGSHTSQLSIQSFTLSDNLAVGNRLSTGGAQSWSGTIQEMVVYPSSQATNRTNIEDNINDFYNIY
jgi:hypothetical protein